MTAHGWNAIWDARAVPAAAPGASLLRRLLDAGGMDSGFARVDEAAWSAFVAGVAARLGTRPGETAFEVGCGAGAFLYELQRRGLAVAGLDRSSELVALAATALPGGDFAVADAADLPLAPPVDHVVSMGVFLYFPSHAYAEAVIGAMAAKARRTVAILDLPDADAATAAAALRERQERAGGAAAYAQRYAGLEHRHYDRAWIAATLTRAGLVDVHVEDQSPAGYGNAPYRFNAWGRRPDGPAAPGAS